MLAPRVLSDKTVFKRATQRTVIGRPDGSPKNLKLTNITGTLEKAPSSQFLGLRTSTFEESNRCMHTRISVQVRRMGYKSTEEAKATRGE